MLWPHWHRHRHHHHERREHISLLVPFRAADEERERIWHWLHEYWRHELPGAEIVRGRDDDYPFSKTRRSTTRRAGPPGTST